jgi:hypothetical protein
MIQVFKLSVRSLLDGRDIAVEHSIAAHRYYNDLIALERRRRGEFRQIRSRHVPGLPESEERVVALETALEVARDEIRALRKKASVVSVSPRKIRPTKDVADDEQRARIEAIQIELKSARSERKSKRAGFDSLLAPGREAYEIRTSKVPDMVRRIQELRRQLADAKAISGNADVSLIKRSLDALKQERKKRENGPRTKERVNADALGAMMQEPEWHAAWKETADLEARILADSKRLRHEYALPPGTYLAVENAVADARKDSVTDPRFRKLSVVGGRKIGVQLRGVTVADVLDGRCRHVQFTLGDFPRGLRGKKREKHDPDSRLLQPATGSCLKRSYGIARLRIGSEGRAPVWLSMEALSWRPAPKDAKVLWAYLVPKRVGLVTHYELQLTLDTQEALVRRSVGTGTATVKFRWSREPESEDEARERGIVFAEVNGSPVSLDGNVYGGMRVAAELRGVADKLFESIKEELVAWLKSNSGPEWMVRAQVPDGDRSRVDITYLSRWREHGRLARVALRWRDDVAVDLAALWQDWKAHRDSVGGDYYTEKPERLADWLSERGITDPQDMMALRLEWWRKKDKHLVQWAADQQRKAIGRRRQAYRGLAAQLCSRFATLEIYDLDLQRVARRRGPENDGDEVMRRVRYQRVVAAPSELRACLMDAFGKERVSVIKRERDGGDEKPGGARKARIRAKKLDLNPMEGDNPGPVAAE